jgi:hypothetical protein
MSREQAMSVPEYGTSKEPNGEWSADDRLRAEAIASLKRKAAFKIHFLVYVMVNVILFAIWIIIAVPTGSWFPWPVFPLLGWGVGVGVHAWTTYRGNELREDRIRAEMNRILGG